MTPHLLIAALAALSFAESSTPTAKVELSTPTPAPAVEVSTVPPTAAELVERVKKLDSTLLGLKANFAQVLETQAGLKQSQTGRLAYKKPDRIRLDFEAPRRQVTISDKKTLQIYQPDEKQIIKADWNEWKKSQSQLTGLLEFGSYATLLEKHDAAVQPEAPGLWRLTLRPKGSSLYTLHMVLGLPDYFPRRTEIAMERMKIVNELSDVELNPTFEPDAFDLKAPPGLPVIDLAAP